MYTIECCIIHLIASRVDHRTIEGNQEYATLDLFNGRSIHFICGVEVMLTSNTNILNTINLVILCRKKASSDIVFSSIGL